MRLSLPLAIVLALAAAGAASASTWTAPDSTRPAPWGGRAAAPAVSIPLQIPQPLPPVAQTPVDPGGVPPVSQMPTDPGYSDPGFSWTDSSGGDGF